MKLTRYDKSNENFIFIDSNIDNSNSKDLFVDNLVSLINNGLKSFHLIFTHLELINFLMIWINIVDLDVDYNKSTS